jgi:DNA-binding NarL/FixJ family response regulator
MIRVLIADDHQMFADGLSGALDSVPDIEVVGVLDDGTGVAAAVEEMVPHVVLVDLEMPKMGGIDAIRSISGDTPVIVVTMHAGADQQREAVEAGAVGFLPKSAPLVDLAAAIRAAAAGVSLEWSSDAERDTVLAAHRTPKLDPGAQSLTAREVELLTLLGQGVSSTEELADRLFISQKTVKNHLASIFSKLSISDRTQAAVEAIRLGFSKPK